MDNEMKAGEVKMKEKINTALENYNQKLRIKLYKTSLLIRLSNGIEIKSKKEIKKFLYRKNKKIYLQNFDIIYGTDLEKSNNCLKKIQRGKGRIPWNKNKKTNIAPWNKGKTKNSDIRLKKNIRRKKRKRQSYVWKKSFSWKQREMIFRCQK